MPTIKVKSSQISSRNWQIGDVLKGNDGEQYTPYDYLQGKVHLRKLNKDERIKAEFLNGRVTL